MTAINAADSVFGQIKGGKFSFWVLGWKPRSRFVGEFGYDWKSADRLRTIHE